MDSRQKEKFAVAAMDTLINGVQTDTDVPPDPLNRFIHKEPLSDLEKEAIRALRDGIVIFDALKDQPELNAYAKTIVPALIGNVYHASDIAEERKKT